MSHSFPLVSRHGHNTKTLDQNSSQPWGLKSESGVRAKLWCLSPLVGNVPSLHTWPLLPHPRRYLGHASIASRMLLKKPRSKIYPLLLLLLCQSSKWGGEATWGYFHPATNLKASAPNMFESGVGCPLSCFIASFPGYGPSMFLLVQLGIKPLISRQMSHTEISHIMFSCTLTRDGH